MGTCLVVEGEKVGDVGSRVSLVEDEVEQLSPQRARKVLSEGTHIGRPRDSFKTARPHQGVNQRRPAAFNSAPLSQQFLRGSMVEGRSVLGGLHNDYRLVAGDHGALDRHDSQDRPRPRSRYGRLLARIVPRHNRLLDSRPAFSQDKPAGLAWRLAPTLFILRTVPEASQRRAPPTG